MVFVQLTVKEGYSNIQCSHWVVHCTTQLFNVRTLVLFYLYWIICHPPLFHVFVTTSLYNIIFKQKLIAC